MQASAPNAAPQRRPLPIIVGIVLIGASLRAPITALGPILGDIQQDLSLSDTAAGVLNALPLMIFALLSLITPALGRRWGLERGLGFALVAISAGIVVRSLPLPGVLWLGTLLASGGIAIGNVLLPGYVKREFPDKAAWLIGLYAASMATFAGLAAGVAVPIAHAAGSSWRIAIACALPLSIIALGVWLPQRASRPPHHRATAQAHSGQTPLTPWKQALGWQVALFFACHSFIFYSLVTWYAAIAAAQGVTPTAAGFDLLLYQVVAVAANLATAPLIKRSKDQRAMGFLCGALLLIGTLGLAAAAPLPLLWLLLAGLGAGFSMSTSLSLFALRASNADQAARLSGMAQFVGYSGSACGPILFGGLHEYAGNWNGSLAMLVLASVLVTLFAVLSGRGKTLR